VTSVASVRWFDVTLLPIVFAYFHESVLLYPICSSAVRAAILSFLAKSIVLSLVCVGALLATKLENPSMIRRMSDIDVFCFLPLKTFE